MLISCVLCGRFRTCERKASSAGVQARNGRSIQVEGATDVRLLDRFPSFAGPLNSQDKHQVRDHPYPINRLQLTYVACRNVLLPKLRHKGLKSAPNKVYISSALGLPYRVNIPQ